MLHDNFKIEIEDQEASDIYADLVSLEVELDDRLAGMFRLRLSLLQQPAEAWTYIDDTRLRVWNKLVVSGGFENDTTELISGFITHVKPEFGPDPSECALEVWGMDASVLLDRERVLKAWPGKKDSDIASEIFSLHSLTPVVEDSKNIHDEQVSTIMQHETDMCLLRRLAQRNGFECYVEGGSGYFRPPQLAAPPQPVLAAHFGGETSLNRFSVEVNALKPTHVAMFQVDRASKQVLDASAESSEQAALGETNAEKVLGSSVDAAKVYVHGRVTTGKPEMDTLCQALYHRAEWFVQAEGEVAANHYGHILKPRATVTIKGVGATHSGIYYVSHVTHSFTPGGYTQRFKARRNSITALGTEPFSAGSSSLLGALA